MHRRRLLQAGLAGFRAAAFAGVLWQRMFATAAPSVEGPYDALRSADANGVDPPAGVTSRIVARSGHPAPGTGYDWHRAPDGGACFADGAGWIYVSNSEVPAVGGASAVRFAADGSVVAAYRILGRDRRQLRRGPLGTWLSCQGVSHGRVFETDPHGRRPAREHLAMGRLKHEAATCDPDRRVVYLTEGEEDGCFYSFAPDV
ncbi:hypothetical protein CS0771_54390 [Catellatospora sp. IY07-71]|nr:hypothetical protein CS0771_54390 [Catellatospora sp. IY07-71]